MSFSKPQRAHTSHGILFVLLFALSSLYLSEIPWISHLGLSSMVIAIVLGIIYGSSLRKNLPENWTPGIQFSAKQLLRLGIILYGFRVSFQQIAAIGVEGFIIDVLMVGLTLTLGSWVGHKVFKLDRDTSILISAGSAICGAAAVLAVEDTLKNEPYKTSIAVATVIVFGTLGMFIYPLLQHAGVLDLTNKQFGLYAGASIHEVAQVVVAGTAVNQGAAVTAVVIKMTRVLLLVPVLLILAMLIKPLTPKTNIHNSKPITIPWFALGFAAVIGFNSLHLLPVIMINIINHIDGFLLTMAMTAIGIETNLKKIKTVGIRPFYFAFVLFVWLMGSAWVLVKYLS